MIPALIIWLAKKILQKEERLLYAKLLLQRVIPALLCTLFFFTLTAQQINHNYIVKYKDDSVGSMQFSLTKTGEDVNVKMTSKVAMRFIVSIDVQSEEEALFKNGKLVRSKSWRRVNGKQKVNNQTWAAGDTYQTLCDNKKGCIRQKLIDYNFLMLYTSEPLAGRTVYSDNFQQFLPVQKVAAHQYKIDLPDGNFNYYFFKDGVCNKVEVHHSFYTITMLLKQ